MAWSDHEKNCGLKFYSELLTKIDFRAAPASSTLHVPLALDFDKNVVEGLVLEVAHEPKAYWCASVVKKKGFLVLLRWIGAKANFNKWRNFAAYKEPESGQVDKRIHHLGWGKDKGLRREPPKSIKEQLMSEYGPHLDSFLEERIRTSEFQLTKDFHGIAKEENEADFRQGMKVEVMDTGEMHVLRPAEVEKDIGRRLQLSFLDDTGTQQFCWFHEFSDEFRPRGWGSLIGREVKPPGYAEESKGRLTGFHEAWQGEDPALQDFKKLITPTSLARWLENNRFEQNSTLEVIDPLRPGISVGTIVRVLRDLFLEIEIEHKQTWKGHRKYKICVPATSHCLLRPGFAADHGLQAYFNPPPETLRYETKPKVPRRALKRFTPPNGFKVGQVLEVASVIGDDLINVGVITGIHDHLLRIHFTDWSQRHDHFFSMLDFNLYPVGWCDLVGHKLTKPEMKENLKQGVDIRRAFVIPQEHRF